MVSQTLIEELKMIIKEDYQIDLQPEEASEIANTLVQFFILLENIESENNIGQGEING